MNNVCYERSGEHQARACYDHVAPYASGGGEVLLCYIASGANKVNHSYHKSDTPKDSQCNPEDHRDPGWVRLCREPFDYEPENPIKLTPVLTQASNVRLFAK